MKRKVSSGFKQYMIFSYFHCINYCVLYYIAGIFCSGQRDEYYPSDFHDGDCYGRLYLRSDRRGLDLSVGSQIAIMNIIICYLIINTGINPILALIIGIAFTTLIGTFNGFVISRTGIPPLIATLAMQTALRGQLSLSLTGIRCTVSRTI